MKLNVTVDIDWIDEEESLDQKIQEKIVDSIGPKISHKAVGSLESDALKQLSTKVDALVEKTYTEFLQRGVTITDQWGDVKKKDVTIYDLIKEKCDTWLLKKVDNEGRESSYGNNWTRMDWLINKQLDQQTKRMSDDIVKRSARQ
ncbi:hypothetical protein [Paenibacillus wynnii]|uniref:Uncharacterized protein n=1 Tax=Paenibacillus wynnii TaxID=268407 RepID=A0A098M8R8_9BACL|nr:hypothetical protein [Paenibacillus wynnii]KGE18456.1 hypothetical protein PWYN_28620 [Paenibacillus wynnii]